jgi:U4/U6.U5 tri-snRNP-associated protein 2
VTEKEEISGDAKRYSLTRYSQLSFCSSYSSRLLPSELLRSLPPYIIMHAKRFVRDTQNRCEKNPTIVNFPIKNLDMRDFCTPEAAAAVTSTRYDLVANICHEGSWDHGVYTTEYLFVDEAILCFYSGIYKIHVLHAANDQW